MTAIQKIVCMWFFFLMMFGTLLAIDKAPADSFLFDGSDIWAISAPAIESISFCAGMGSAYLTITWNDSLDVKYPGEITDAAREFFDFLKDCINADYILVPREGKK